MASCFHESMEKSVCSLGELHINRNRKGCNFEKRVCVLTTVIFQFDQGFRHDEEIDITGAHIYANITKPDKTEPLMFLVCVFFSSV